MYHGLRLAVIVPAYNEADRIATTLAGIPDYVDLVVVIDDASRDATAERAQDCRRENLCVLRHPQNRGVGAAIGSGYRLALSRGCDVAVVMAGDGQMDPADLPALLRPIVRGEADYSKGNRFAHAEIWLAMPKLRLLGNIVLSLLSRAASGYWQIFDSQCGYTAVTSQALRAIDLDRLYPRYGYPNDLLTRLAVAGMRVVDVPVRPIYGPGWRSGIGLLTAIYPVLFVVLRSFLWRWLRLLSGRSAGRGQISGRLAPLARPQLPEGERSQGDSSSSSVKSSAGSSRAPRM